MGEKIKKITNIIFEILFRTGGTIMFLVVLMGMMTMSITLWNFSFMLMTTNITILLVCLAYVFNLDKPFLNSVACVPFLMFFFVDLGAHLALAIFQTIIICTRKKFSKHGILYGYIFYLIFMFTYDNIDRMVELIWIKFAPEQFIVAVFYLLTISAVILYLIKRWQKLLINNNRR